MGGIIQIAQYFAIKNGEKRLKPTKIGWESGLPRARGAGGLNRRVSPAFVACNRRSDYPREPRRGQGASKEIAKEIANPP